MLGLGCAFSPLSLLNPHCSLASSAFRSHLPMRIQGPGMFYINQGHEDQEEATEWPILSDCALRGLRAVPAGVPTGGKGKGIIHEAFLASAALLLASSLVTGD